MSYTNYKQGVGLNNVGSYQVSGKPWATGSINATDAVLVSFPSVTRWVYVVNHDGSNACKVGFSENGVSGSNYIRVASDGASQRLEIKVTELYLYGANGVDIMAGLSFVPNERINYSDGSPSGSNWSGSAGVG